MAKYCGKCGVEIQDNTAVFCPNCGSAVQEENIDISSVSEKVEKSAKVKKPKKKLRIVIACVLAFAMLVVGTIGGLKFFGNKNADIISDVNYTALAEGFTDVLITDENTAIEAVGSVADLLGINDAEKELKSKSTNQVGEDKYYRLQQYYNDIPVFGRNITVVADENGKSLGLTANYTPIEKIETEPKITKDEISEKIKNEYDGVDSQINNGLVIYNLDNSSPVLAYDITISKTTETNVIYEQCLISADNGKILFKNNLIRTDIEHSSDEYTYKVNDKTYLMYDETRNILVLNSNKKILEVTTDTKDGTEYTVLTNDAKTNENENPLWNKTKVLLYGDIQIEGSSKAKWKDDAIDLINSLENTYEFYSNILKWKGFNNQNTILPVSYNDKISNGDNGNNAYSKGGLLVFGFKKDLTDVGLIGHEYTHSVEWIKSGMIYSGESGAVMEAYSDVFGELAEDYAYDGTMNGVGCDWIHGQRNMINPSENSYPSTYAGENWGDTIPKYDANKETTNDYGSVHTNNTVLSHAAYLMSSGVNNNEKIDNETLARLWFNALDLLQKNTSFSQCRNAIELSARIMVKNGEMTDKQYFTVIAAFDAVGIDSAAFTYTKTVKNKFDLSVLSSETTENVTFKLEVIKMPTIKAGPNILNNEMPKLVLEKNAIKGHHELELKDGTYVIRVTDLDEENTLSKTISTKIVVDGDNENAVDTVTIHTDFSDIITVILNEPNNENLYNEVIQQYKKAIDNNFYQDILDGDYLDVKGEYVSEMLLLHSRYYDDFKVFYSLIDINNDNIPELVIGAGENANKVGEYDIFTSQSGKIHPLFAVGENGERTNFTLYDNGVIQSSGSGGAEYHGFEYYVLPENATQLKFIDGYTAIENEYSQIDSNYKSIKTVDENTYYTEWEKYKSKETVLKWSEIKSNKDNTDNKNVSGEEVIRIENHTTLTLSGVIVDEYYEIHSENTGTVYILNLTEQIKGKLYDDLMGYNGEEKVIDSVQVNISETEYEKHKGKIVTVTGNVMIGHTGHHRRDIVLDDCVIKSNSSQNAESQEQESSSYAGNQTAEQLRKSILGEWGPMGYTFEDNGVCYYLGDTNNPGTYEITNDKTLIIEFPWTNNEYLWSDLSFSEFHEEYDHDIYFWYFTEDDKLRLNGSDYYRDGVIRF